MFNKPEDLARSSTRTTVPVLVERDLMLSEPNIINEYTNVSASAADARADPIMRARARQLLVGMERETFSFMETIESTHADKARQGNLRPPDRDHSDLQQAEIHAG